MTIQELGAVGELVSGIAVLITIIYLAVQVRQAKYSMKASIRQMAAAESRALSESIFNSPYMPLVLQKVLDNKELSLEEANRCAAFLSGLHRQFEGIYFLAKSGNLPMETLDSNSIWFLEDGFASTEFARRYWSRVRTSYDPDYMKWVDSMLHQSDA